MAPSLPGYAWSDKPTRPIGPRTVAGLYDRLMPALGYDRYLYQGGDWGCVIGGWIGLDSARVDAIHLNGFGLRPADIRPTTPEEERWLATAQAIRATETAYLQLPGTKPPSRSRRRVACLIELYGFLKGTYYVYYERHVLTTLVDLAQHERSS